MEQHRMERGLAHLRIAGEDHADDPEKDNVISRHKHVVWIKILQILRLLRPAKRGERPQRGREPGVQRVLILP